MKFLKTYLPLLLLLLFHIAIRAHNITRQVPHVDEGFHVSRAIQVWDFAQNPGRFMHGKLLIYYWLGLFDLQPVTSLYVARTAMALFSLITPATLYLLGKRFNNPATGLLAMLLYALMPYAVFFERLAMVDPFANTFATLVAWRSIVFAKRPTIREGVILGILIALTLMAKLTMGLVPFLPVFASLIYYNWSLSNWKHHLHTWSKTYIPPLIISAMIVVVSWLPILVPALFASFTDNPFTLLSENNLQQVNSISPLDVLHFVFPQIIYLTTRAFFALSIIAFGYLLYDKTSKQDATYILIWVFLITIFPLLFANQPRPRYFMPLMSPLIVIIAYTGSKLWQDEYTFSALQRVTKFAIISSIGFWIITFAIPFDYTASSVPTDLELSSRETKLYLIGTESGIPIEQSAKIIESANPPAEYIYAAWGTCQVFYFYTTIPVRCMAGVTTPTEVMNHDITYVVINTEEGLSREGIQDIIWTLLARFERLGIGTVVEVWQAINLQIESVYP